MKSTSLEAKVIAARARVAALRGDERADYPSGPERSAYNKEFKNALKLLQKWESAFGSYAPGGSGALRHSPRSRSGGRAVPIGGAAYDPNLTPALVPPPPLKTKLVRKKTKRLTPAARAKHISNAAKQKRMEEAMAALPVYTDAQREAIIALRLVRQQIHQQERLARLAALAAASRHSGAMLGCEWEVSQRHPGTVRLRPRKPA